MSRSRHRIIGTNLADFKRDVQGEPVATHDAVNKFTANTGGDAMLNVRWVAGLMVLGLLVGMQGCAELSGSSPQRMINANDHVGLANYYAQQAQELREKAKSWESMAEYYEQHSEGLSGERIGGQAGMSLQQHVTHCRAIAQNYKKSADEADALATEHRAMRPHGMVQ